ncbi:MAG: hypothetical protein ACHQU0_02085 [Candidatus Paceibacteria bacterium]
MLMYVSEYDPDEEALLKMEGGLSLNLSQLPNILEILSKFPKREGQSNIFAIARFDLAKGDKETMFVFGWSETKGWREDGWRPFYKLSLSEILVTKREILWERLVKESLTSAEYHPRVALG